MTVRRHDSISTYRSICAVVIRHSLPYLVSVALLAGCDDTFSPTEQTELQFSVFGYLDASADTQWIRIMPIRPVLPTSPDSLGVIATIEHVESGEIITLRDSIFRFTPANPDVGGEVLHLHNFWTSAAIQPGDTYRFSARQDGQPPSEAEVRIPPDYGVEMWLRQPGSVGQDQLRLEGLPHVALVQVHLIYAGGCVEKHNFESEHSEGDRHAVEIYRGGGRPRGECGPAALDRTEIFVVGSGAEWPSGLASSVFGLGLSDGSEHISNAVGFLGGVLTRQFPYDSCRIENADPMPDFCRLSYDASSVTLTGMVRDANCGGAGVAGATVQLREIDPDPDAPVRVRFTTTRGPGQYQIGALEGDRPYLLTVQPAGSGPWPFEPHTETLQFPPGERLAHRIDLVRSGCDA